MRLLLDTHTLIWYLEKSNKLPSTTTDLISCTKDVFVSIVSLWEIEIKRNNGKLFFPLSTLELASECQKNSVGILGISPTHINELSKLPEIHKDPFDRMLIAQSRVEGLSFVTRDEVIRAYGGVTTLW